MSESSKGRTALITGASAGIGVVYAERLASSGYNVVLVARRADRLAQLADRLGREFKIKAEPLVADLTDRAQVEKVEARLRGDEALHLLVNNAGFGGYRPFAELEPTVADQLLGIHVEAVTRLTRAALSGMLRRKSGAVINVASLLALSGTLPATPLPYRAIYGGAKAFMVAFTQLLAGELAGSGVDVQVCLPGMVATEFHSVQGIDRGALPVMTPQDVVTASLAALKRREVTCVPGLEDPALLDRLGEAQRAVMMAANRPGLAARYQS